MRMLTRQGAQGKLTQASDDDHWQDAVLVWWAFVLLLVCALIVWPFIPLIRLSWLSHLRIIGLVEISEPVQRVDGPLI